MKSTFRLILVPYKTNKLKPGLLFKWNTFIEDDHHDRINSLTKHDLENEHIIAMVPDMLVDPYLISEKDKVSIGDMVYDSDTNSVFEVLEEEELTKGYKKIIAFPEQIGFLDTSKISSIDFKEITAVDIQRILDDDGYCQIKMVYVDEQNKKSGKKPLFLENKVIIEIL